MLENKTALVTGASRGIGKAIVEKFLANGANVIGMARSNCPAELKGRVHWQKLDISNEVQVKKAMKKIGTLDILVNNAGIQIEKTILETTKKDWQNLMGINCYAVFLMSQQAIPKMKQGGVIINIGSISGNVADKSMALYNASKSFVHGLTRSIAIDHGPKIRCNTICPGWINTGMLEAGFQIAKNPAKAKSEAKEKHATKTFGKPEDIAEMAVWLASQKAKFATGQMFTIDGGLTASSPIS